MAPCASAGGADGTHVASLPDPIRSVGAMSVEEIHRAKRTHERQRESREVQRTQVLRAMAEIVAANGLGKTTVTAVTRRSLVSRATFARLFGTLERCFAMLVDYLAASILEEIREAVVAESLWPDGVISGLQALLIFLDREPALARVALIEAMASPLVIVEHRPNIVQQVTSLLHRQSDGHQAYGWSSALPTQLMAEAMVGSVSGILRARLLAGQAPPFISLLGELVVVVTLPYVGPTQAASMRSVGDRRAMVLRPPLTSHTDCAESHGGATIGVLIPRQLSRPNAYSARAVLRYVAANPGISNKGVASGAGIEHLGQVSTLLARLERAGVLIKRAGGAGRPNAWKLSRYGEQVVSLLKDR